MIYWSLEVSMVSGAILEYPESLKEGTKDYNTILVLCDLPGKQTSIATKVGRHVINNNLQNPKITLDKSNVGSLTPGDKVSIRDFKPPIAKQVLLAIDTKYYLPDGDWGNKIVNPAVKGQIVDVGQNIDFMYGNQKPMFVTGQIKSTIPKAPALVDDQTIFLVEKLPRDVLARLKVESEQHSETRAFEYFKLIEEEKFDTLSDIRNNSVNKIEKTFNFAQVEPESVYKSFKQTLQAMSHSFYVDQFEVVGENYLASILSYPQTKKGMKPDFCIEFKLTATMKQGTCFVSGYSPKTDSMVGVIDDLIKQIRKVSTSLKEVPQVIPDVCSGCQARLNLTFQNAKGVVICEACKTPNQLPFSLRL